MDWLDAGQFASWSVGPSAGQDQRRRQGVVVLLHRTEHGAELLERCPTLTPSARAPSGDAKTFGIGAQMLKALGGRMTPARSRARSPA